MAFQYFDTRIENRVGWLVQNYPPVNAFGWDMLQKMEQGFIKMIEDPEVQVMVFASTLDKFFCVGGDLNAFVDIGEEGMERWVTICHRMVRLLRASPKPLMAAINGVAVGGRLEVTWHFDFRFAAAAARLGQPEIKLGVFAPAATCLLTARVGRVQAADILLSGRSLRADEALACGLVNDVSGDAGEAALAYFDKHLAGLSSAALKVATQALAIGQAEDLKAKLDAVEALYLNDLMATHDGNEGLAAFMEKRQPKWEHR